MKLYFKYAKSRVIIIRSLKVALLVGTILAIINHSDAILSGEFNTTNVVQIFLTYLVPYFVAIYGSVEQARHFEMEKSEDL